MRKFLSALMILCAFSSCSYAATTAKPDIDFTKFSSVMLYSGVFNILANPSAYLGKTIKIRGQFDWARDENTGKTFFGVIVSDASACCSTGFDFVLKDSYSFPSDYPKRGNTITVLGKLERYKEGEDTYFHLVDADLVK